MQIHIEADEPHSILAVPAPRGAAASATLKMLVSPRID
jgi:hypothetical protein